MADRKRILVVDDDVDLVELLKADLEHLGYEVAVAKEGQEALAKAQSQRFDVLLLDVMMPGIDGYHVANALSSDWNKDLRIILMTSRDTRREKGLALLAGAAGMVQKPFTLDALHHKIQDVLKAAEK
jgi:DNA-binding response OmpR family regulator